MIEDTAPAAQDRFAAARAAKAAKREPEATVPVPEGHMMVRVLKRGHDRIFTGTHDPHSKTDRFPRYQRNDVFALPKALFAKYEDDGWVEAV